MVKNIVKFLITNSYRNIAWFLTLFGLLFSILTFFNVWEMYYLIFKSGDILTFSGLLLTAAGLFFNAHISKNERLEKESKFYLEKYMQTCDIVFERLISDKPTRRMAWVTAAELSDKVTNFEKKITNELDINFLDVYNRNLMHLILNFFSDKSAMYFYGFNSSDSIKNLDEAYKNNHIFGKAYSETIENFPLLHRVDEEQINSVLQLIDSEFKKNVGFSMFDQDGKIHLNVLKFNKKIWPGLYEYINHKRIKDSK